MKDKHVHKFKRHRYKSGTEVFFCALPDCSIKMSIPLSLGKRTICWRCGNDFIMNDYSIRLAKPHCDECHKPKKMIGSEEKYVSSEHAVTIIPIEAMSLAERLQQTINQAKPTIEDEEI